jgi:uncharacterized protein YgiM (DUF1202 family)
MKDPQAFEAGRHLSVGARHGLLRAVRRGWHLGCLALLGVAGALAGDADSTSSGVVVRDRVNVRGRPTIFSEVITQLRKDETVAILEEVTLKNPGKGEPADWLKIRLPANTPVWVNAAFVDTNSFTVKARRLNLRGGPGENFSVLGSVGREATVREIRTVDDWMEIEAPTNAVAYVAADFVERSATTAPAAETAPETMAPAEAGDTNAGVKPPADTPPTKVDKEPDQPEPAPVESQPADRKPAEARTGQTDPAGAPVPVTRRLVRREGTVRNTKLADAPAAYLLEGEEAGTVVVYLKEASGMNVLQIYLGKKVVVSGEETVTASSSRPPVLEVQTVKLAP